MSGCHVHLPNKILLPVRYCIALNSFSPCKIIANTRWVAQLCSYRATTPHATKRKEYLSKFCNHQFWWSLWYLKSRWEHQCFLPFQALFWLFTRQPSVSICSDNLQCVSLEDCQVYSEQLDVTTWTFRVFLVFSILSKENSWLYR